MRVTDRHDMTLPVKVALNPYTNKKTRANKGWFGKWLYVGKGLQGHKRDWQIDRAKNEKLRGSLQKFVSLSRKEAV